MGWTQLSSRQLSFKAASSLAGTLGLWLMTACSSDSGGSKATGGASANGGSNGGSTNGGTPATGGSSSGGAPATAGMPSSGGTSGSGGTSNGGAGSANGGSAGSGPSSGGGGATSGGQGGLGGGVFGTAGSSAGGAAAGTSAGCPEAATFCSGFEATTLPTGAVYKANAAPGDWSRDFEVDSTVARSGRSSLRVKAGSEAGVSGSYKMLAVPTPGAAFWVRFYVQQTEFDIGGLEHNVFAGASGSDEPNDGVMVEFAEDVGVAFNSKDAVRWPSGYGRTSTGGTMPFTLGKAMWHCVEISYDSQTRVQKLFVNGMPQIDASDFPAAASLTTAFKVFKFGFNQLHGPARKVWYDDVAVAATRINCP